MASIYSIKNQIKFTDISERYSVPKKYKAKQGEVHSALILYVISHFQNTRRYKQKIVDALNLLTYCIFSNEVPPFDWKLDAPLDNMPSIDEDLIKDVIGDYYLTVDAISWDVSPTMSSSAAPVVESSTSVESISKEIKPSVKSTANKSTPKYESTPISETRLTPKEDLYIKSPMYPRFDFTKPWLSIQDRGEQLTIYTTLPEIPTKQCEISVTTDIESLADSELVNLYPNRFIRTRAASMYEPVPGLPYDPDLGVVLPINNMSIEDLVDNIIRYPHFYKLKRILDDGSLASFYQYIEIDRKLYNVLDIWDSLDDTKLIPKQSDFIKEYVIRRYILEKESGMEHRYRMYGTLDPFLTLFMPIDMYISRGYDDISDLARTCVRSRVSFKQSRNPILKRLGEHA